ncbi:MAG: YgiT-type zinc finger protein [Candidatus Omnitrophica bacterium]|nr:YgiT-type zinc finger protein [Candidatus Omnitrophota bacterium]
MKNILCAQCGGKLHKQKTSLDRMTEGHLYLFADVSVQVCDQCGEIWIPGTLAERMDQAIQGKIKPKKLIPVPVY